MRFPKFNWEPTTTNPFSKAVALPPSNEKLRNALQHQDFANHRRSHYDHTIWIEEIYRECHYRISIQEERRQQHRITTPRSASGIRIDALSYPASKMNRTSTQTKTSIRPRAVNSILGIYHDDTQLLDQVERESEFPRWTKSLYLAESDKNGTLLLIDGIPSQTSNVEKKQIGTIAIRVYW